MVFHQGFNADFTSVNKEVQVTDKQALMQTSYILKMKIPNFVFTRIRDFYFLRKFWKLIKIRFSLF